MSFFDEADEPQPPRPEPRRPRSAPRSSGGRGGGRPPANNQQSIQTRRLVFAVAIVIVVILMAVLIHGCEASQAATSLRDYNNSVSQLITRSDQNGARMFRELATGQGSSSSGANALENDLTFELKNANQQLTQAQDLNTPGAVASAEQNFVLVMTERRDGIRQIAENLQSALSHSTSKDGVYALTLGTSLLYSSDVIYKAYVAPQIAKALHGDNIEVCPAGTPGGSCGTGSVSINTGQIVPDLGWLQVKFVGAKIGASLPSSIVNTSCPSGDVCGDSIGPVSVSGSTLSTSSTNTVSANPAPTFTIAVTNGGQVAEDVTCKISVSGLSDSATGTLPSLAASQTQNCSVTLPSSPPAGTYKVTATVEKVPGETNLQNNTQTYTITFQ